MVGGTLSSWISSSFCRPSTDQINYCLANKSRIRSIAVNSNQNWICCIQLSVKYSCTWYSSTYNKTLWFDFQFQCWLSTGCARKYFEQQWTMPTKLWIHKLCQLVLRIHFYAHSSINKSNKVKIKCLKSIKIQLDEFQFVPYFTNYLHEIHSVSNVTAK